MKLDEIIIQRRSLKEILEKHQLWLNSEGKEGECADLTLVNLPHANLAGVNLTRANLGGANLSGANLKHACLENVNLDYAILEGVNLIDANLRGAFLEGTNLDGANLRRANFYNAKLRGVNLEQTYYDYTTQFLTLQCPKEGSFIGYKKAGKCIVKLQILEDARRSSATTRKCRCDKAKVLSIEHIETREKIEKVCSNRDENFIYRVGEIVTVDDFDEDRWKECTSGIHFFITREEAEEYE